MLHLDISKHDLAKNTAFSSNSHCDLEILSTSLKISTNQCTVKVKEDNVQFLQLWLVGQPLMITKPEVKRLVTGYDTQKLTSKSKQNDAEDRTEEDMI